MHTALGRTEDVLVKLVSRAALQRIFTKLNTADRLVVPLITVV